MRIPQLLNSARHGTIPRKSFLALLTRCALGAIVPPLAKLQLWPQEEPMDRRKVRVVIDHETRRLLRIAAPQADQTMQQLAIAAIRAGLPILARQTAAAAGEMACHSLYHGGNERQVG
jgi:hypothetical protein